MKNSSKGIISFAIISLIIYLISVSEGLSQNKENASKAVKIPENLKPIFQNSCSPCHWKGGGIKSTLHVNFSKWDNYEPDKQVQKARKICSVLADDKMPPASARKTRPDIILTNDQIDAICQWSKNLSKEPGK